MKARTASDVASMLHDQLIAWRGSDEWDESCERAYVAFRELKSRESAQCALSAYHNPLSACAECGLNPKERELAFSRGKHTCPELTHLLSPAVLPDEIDEDPDEYLAPTYWASNGEAGDDDSICSVCNESTDEGHTHAQCYKAGADVGDFAGYHRAIELISKGVFGEYDCETLDGLVERLLNSRKPVVWVVTDEDDFPIDVCRSYDVAVSDSSPGDMVQGFSPVTERVSVKLPQPESRLSPQVTTPALTQVRSRRRSRGKWRLLSEAPPPSGRIAVAVTGDNVSVAEVVGRWAGPEGTLVFVLPPIPAALRDLAKGR